MRRDYAPGPPSLAVRRSVNLRRPESGENRNTFKLLRIRWHFQSRAMLSTKLGWEFETEFWPPKTRSSELFSQDSLMFLGTPGWIRKG